MAENDLMIYDEDDLKSKIYIIRGVQVMLDFDLAKIYGYETKRFNEQVKNNIERFDDDFRFQLTKIEYEEILRSKFSTSKQENRGGRQYLPYAFTEQGIYMLMTVLKGEIAVNQSKKLIRLFKQMKDFIVQLNDMLPAGEVRALSIQTQRNTEDIRQIKQQVNDLAIVIIDNYIGLKTLVLLKSVAKNVKVTIFSDNVNHSFHSAEFADFQKEYPNVNIKLKTLGGTYHDRYIFIDSGTQNEMIFHCGGSSKDVGKRVTSITKVEDVMLYQGIISSLQDNPILKL
jgi:hypothetical protein